MSRSAQKQISLTKNIKYPNEYIKLFQKEEWTIDEETAVKYKGSWRNLFKKNRANFLHLEIGCGNGKHFSNLCLKKTQDCFLGIEIKYKPLIQTIRRIKKNNIQNARVIRFNARWIDSLFEPEELNNVYIHFPDPWLKKRKSKKHQLIQPDFCKQLYQVQKSNSFLEFKTDSKDYFEQSVKEFKKAGYKLEKYETDLYKQKEPLLNNLSQFELIFVKKNLPIHYCLFIKI